MGEEEEEEEVAAKVRLGSGGKERKAGWRFIEARTELKRKKERRGGERENASRVTKSTEAKSVCIFRYLGNFERKFVGNRQTAFPKNSWDSQI